MDAPVLLFVVWFLGAPILLIFLLVKWQKARKAVRSLQEKQTHSEEALAEHTRKQADLLAKVSSLAKYQTVADADAAAATIKQEADRLLERSRHQAEEIISTAQQAAKEARQEATRTAQARIDKADQKLAEAHNEASLIIASATQRAEEIAGEAYVAMAKAKDLTATAQAMKNIIEGYGDAYIIPTYSLLDELADDFGFTEAGQNLKTARAISNSMHKERRAATCDYAEPIRRQTAINFVVDAFNGKVDTILARSKADNHGTLAQQIKDAFALVNKNGAAFRNARITPEYLDARLNELKWAAVAHALKDEEREKQRQLREQMREEEKARREYERAMKEAAKEEDTLRKAMEKAQQQVAAASEAQRAEFEAKLLDLQAKLAAAEDKNQRALSMAQQTRAGHVYIISNIGSFGEEVFKIGMTRRLDPNDRIRELGDASVPFEFDVHAMVFNEDAPALEKALHRHFLSQQVNKVNPRKEFFRLSLTDIRQELESLGVEAQWTMTAAAHEYRETLRIEQQIRENPAIAAQWSQHQLEEVEAEDAVEEAV